MPFLAFASKHHGDVVTPNNGRQVQAHGRQDVIPCLDGKSPLGEIPSTTAGTVGSEGSQSPAPGTDAANNAEAVSGSRVEVRLRERRPEVENPSEQLGGLRSGEVFVFEADDKVIPDASHSITP